MSGTETRRLRERPSSMARRIPHRGHDVACNYQGVMLRHGILRADRTAKGHYGVIAVNVP
jgi:hypothetical protein